MAKTTLQLGFVPKNRGEYQSTPVTRYYKDNVVQYNGSSYIVDPVGWSESDPTATYVTIPPTDESGNLNTGWKVFASGNNTFTTGEKVDNIGIDSEPTAESNNLVKSGGVYKKINQLGQEVNGLAPLTEYVGRLESTAAMISNISTARYMVVLVGANDTVKLTAGASGCFYYVVSQFTFNPVLPYNLVLATGESSRHVVSAGDVLTYTMPSDATYIVIRGTVSSLSINGRDVLKSLSASLGDTNNNVKELSEVDNNIIHDISGKYTNNTYPFKYGFIESYSYKQTMVCMTYLSFVKGHTYKCVIRSSESFTPNGDFNLKIMNGVSDTAVYRIASLSGVAITTNAYNFTWENDSVDEYRIGFYGIITTSPVLEVFLFDLTYQQEIERLFGEVDKYKNKLILSDTTFIDNTGLRVDGVLRDNTPAIVCESYFPIDRKNFDSIALSSYTQPNGNLIHLCVAWYDKDKTFISPRTGYDLATMVSAPSNAKYFRFALQLFDSDDELLENSSPYQANYNFSDIFIYYNDAAQSIRNKEDIITFIPGDESIFAYNSKRNCIDKLVQLKSVQDGDNLVHSSTTSLSNTNSILTLLHFSDLHADVNNLKRIVEFWNEFKGTYITDIIHTGDSAYSKIDDSSSVPMVFERVNGAERILNVVGNHDAWLTDTTWYDATSKQSYDYLFKGTGTTPLVDNWGVEQPANAETSGLCYYYKDYSDKEIRLIVLDCMHNDTAQETWFVSLLNETITEGDDAYGYNVIVAVHYQSQCGLTAKNTTFNCLDGDVDGVTKSNYPSANTDVTDIPDITGTYHVERLPNRFYQMVDTFINNDGKFICWLCGHAHKDFFGVVTGFTNQVQITIDTANRTKGDNYNWESRVNHTQSCDCFNVIGFDTLHKIIKIIRIGVNRDSRMRLIDTMCYDYENGTVISNN